MTNTITADNDKYYELTDGPYQGIVTRSHNGKWYVYGGASWVRAVEPQSLYGSKNGEWHGRYRIVSKSDASVLVNARQTQMRKLVALSQEIAKRAFGRQSDSRGRLVVDDRIRVARHMTTQDGAIVALLDGTIGNGVTIDSLRKVGYPSNILIAMDAITPRDGEPRDEYIARVKANPIARSVKVTWLRGELNTHNAALASDDEDRLTRCRQTLAYLEK